MVKVRFAAITRAPKFGVYPKSSTARMTRARVAATTCSGEFKHLETVAVDTLAALATSSNVGAAGAVAFVDFGDKTFHSKLLTEP